MPSFLQCLPYLLNEPSPFGVSDVTMMWLLIRLIKPRIRFCRGHPVGAVSLPSDLRLPATPLSRSAGLMVQGVTPAHKGLFPKGSLCGTLKIYDLHSCKPRHPCRAHTMHFKRILPLLDRNQPINFAKILSFVHIKDLKWQNRLNAMQLTSFSSIYDI